MYLRYLFQVLLFFLIAPGSLWAQQPSIGYPNGASTQVVLAAQEVRRYVYLRTDAWGSLTALDRIPDSTDIILIAPQGNPILDPIKDLIGHTLSPGAILIKSIQAGGRQILVVSGADAIATLHASYRLVEYLGVSFDLSGDVIPDTKINLDLSGYDEVGVPLFETRGIQPFHDFHQGPDFWSLGDYQAIISQLPKLGMNFIGFHTYPRHSTTEERVLDVRQGPEPNVWIGLPEDINADGTVNWSYPAFYAHTHRPHRIWGSVTLNTDQFHAGSQQLFSNNQFGSQVFDQGIPTDMASSNAVFNRVGELFDQAFTHARNLGVKTAVGTELTLGQEPKGPEVGENWVRVMPLELQDRLLEQGLHPSTSPAVKKVYRGIFERIMKTHPLDYYWLWSWEVWSNFGVSPEQINAFKFDIKAAQEVLDELGNPFQLGLAGWRIGTVENHAEFDNTLPPEAPYFGLWDEAEGFEQLQPERIKWAATWPEEDWGLLQPQLELHRFYKDTKAAQEKACHGFIAKHWRTRVLGANISSLKSLQWTYGRTGTTITPTVPPVSNTWIDQFYLDWATRNFGSEAAEPIATLFANLDKAGEPGSPGAVPVVTDWDTDDEDSNNAAPGAITANENSWSEEKDKFSFVAELERIRPRVVGAANLDRFDYWLKTMQVFRLMAEYGVLRYQFEVTMEAGNWPVALDYRKQMARLFEQIQTLEIEKTVNASDLGEIVNLEILNWHQLMELKWDQELKEGLGTPIPEEANPAGMYTGKAFIRATPMRTQLYAGEDYRLKVWVMGELQNPMLYWRYLGTNSFQSIPITPVARSVYEVTIPNPTGDFEFYLEAAGAAGTEVFPAAAPKINATVVVLNTSVTVNTLERPVKSGKLQVFPNPARDSISIEWPSDEAMAKRVGLQLMDASGKLILNKEVEQLTGDTLQVDLPKGIVAGSYSLHVSVDGSRYSEKVILVD